MKKKIELINYKEFAIVALDLEKKAFVVHVVLLEVQNIMHPLCKA